MKRKTLYILWGAMYALCAGFSFLPDPVGVVRGALFVLSLGFFVPPCLLIYQAVYQRHRQTVVVIRNLSIASLALTVVMLMLTVLAVAGRAKDALGWILQVLLILVSTPMLCSGVWVVSLFLWAMLLMVCLHLLKDPEKKKK